MVNGTLKILQHLLKDFQNVCLTILWTLGTTELNKPARDIVYEGTQPAFTCLKSNQIWTNSLCYSIRYVTAHRWRHWPRSVVFNVNFEQISNIVLVGFVVGFEQVNVSWGGATML